MTRFGKTILAAASAATAIAAVPADARPYEGRHYDRHDGIDAGDVIAGALVIGGIAAIASAASNDRRYGRGDRYNDGRYYESDTGYYNNGYDSRQAVDQCVRAAQRDAGRYGWARVTDVGSIQRVRGGYEVRGRLVVEQRGWRGGDRWRGGDDRYGYRYDRYNDGYDKGRFTCVTRYGQVADVRLGGLRSY